jgi:hypothetical protein
MKPRIIVIILAMFLAALACGQPPAPTTLPTLPVSPFDSGQTAYGFFPSPPEASLQSILDMYLDLGQHADVILLQQNIPWQDFAQGSDGESATIEDIDNQYLLARQNGLDVIFVVDPLNGLNRSEFYQLPVGWPASFAAPQVRNAYTNFTLRVLREFQPRYLGLASEINTYADAHPEDFAHYLSLYQEVYDQVKAASSETQVFVTFQWEDLNNVISFTAEGRQPYQTNWEQVEAFEPRLDVWVISSYPFAAFRSAKEIPSDYYTPLLTRTHKALAVAEGGYTSRPVGPFQGAPGDQVAYLNAIHDQLGTRLAFWIYLLLSDFNLDSYANIMRQRGQDQDIDTLGWFASVGLRQHDGTPKPALEVWDNFRRDE